MRDQVFQFGVTSPSQDVPFTFGMSARNISIVRVDSVVTSEPGFIESKSKEIKSSKVDGIRYVQIRKTISDDAGENMEIEDWETYECDDKSGNDEPPIHHQPKPRVVHKKKLVVVPFHTNIINLSPPNSPVSTNGGGTSNPIAASSAYSHQPSTPIQDMATYLEQLFLSQASEAHIRSAEDDLVDHLHYTAVTLSDVEAILPPHSWNARHQAPILPSLSPNARVMGKLAANIGLNASRGHISANELEAIKIHILTHGDPVSWLYDRVNEQLERFQADSEAYKLNRLTAKQKRQHVHQEKQRMQQEDKVKKIAAAKQARELKRFLVAVPKEWQKPWEHSPFESFVDYILEAYGPKHTWDWLPKPTWVDPLGEGSFTQLRLHNGPGWSDRKIPRVCIPKIKRKLPRRKLHSTCVDELLSGQMQTMSLCNLDSPTVGARERVVVRFLSP